MPASVDPSHPGNAVPVPAPPRTDGGTLPGVFGAFRSPSPPHVRPLPEPRPPWRGPRDAAADAGPATGGSASPGPSNGLAPRVAAGVAGVAFLTARELQCLPGGGKAKWVRAVAGLASIGVAQAAHALAGATTGSNEAAEPEGGE